MSELPGWRRWAAALVLAAGAAALSGCGSMMGQLPLIGLPSGAQVSPEEEEQPPPPLRREAEATEEERPRVLSEAERAALEAELRAVGARATEERRRRINQP